MRIVQGIVFGLMCIAVLSACHPTFTVKQTELYARTLGVSNQFDIHRRNTRVLAVSSRLCVIAKPQKEVDMQALSTVVASGLSPFFHRVSAVENVHSMTSAVAMARKYRADFVVYIRLADSDSLYQYDKPDSSIKYNQLQLLLTVVDVNNGEVVDKIRMLAKPSHLNLAGKDMHSLLAKPVKQIGHDLSGV